MDNLDKELLKFDNKDFMEAVTAACAMVAFADGVVSLDEKLKMIGFIQHNDALKVFETSRVIDTFNAFAEGFERNPDIGRADALRAVSNILTKPDNASLLIRVCCAVCAADGEFDAREEEAIMALSHELKLNVDETKEVVRVFRKKTKDGGKLWDDSEISPGAPDEVVTPLPYDAVTDLPNEELTIIPDEAVTDLPDEQVIIIPDEAVTDLPDEEAATLPDDAVTDLPDEAMADAPVDDSETGKQKQRVASEAASGAAAEPGVGRKGKTTEVALTGLEFIFLRKGKRTDDVEDHIFDARNGGLIFRCQNVSAASRFDVKINTPGGEIVFNIREGSERDSAEIFSGKNRLVARIARTSSIFKHFETSNAKGNRILQIESKGQDSWEIKKENSRIGVIRSLDKAGVRDTLVAVYDDLDRKGYDYRYLVRLEGEIDETTKRLIMGNILLMLHLR